MQYFVLKSSDDNSSRALAAPIIIDSILIPAVAIGNKPTAVKTEYLPPTSSGTTKVSYPSLSANCFKAPFDLSVVAKIRFSLHLSIFIFD